MANRPTKSVRRVIFNGKLRIVVLPEGSEYYKYIRVEEILRLLERSYSSEQPVLSKKVVEKFAYGGYAPTL